MKWRVRVAGRVRVLELDGEIKLSSGDPGLHEAAISLLDAGHVHLLADMRFVRLIDTMGLGEMVIIRKKTREGGGDFKLLSPSPAVRRVLRATRLDMVFETFDDEIEALGSFRS
jgi:anti-sigma B factor antagonist